MRYPAEACQLEVVPDAALVPHRLLALQVALLPGQEPGGGVDPLAGGDRDLGRCKGLVPFFAMSSKPTKLRLVALAVVVSLIL